jgi:hypothetical protein
MTSRIRNNPIHLSLFVIIFFAVTPILLQQALAEDPYSTGYSHGCGDARISTPSLMYIGQPDKGPNFHTLSFMQGYYTGYKGCGGNLAILLQVLLHVYR